MMMTRFVLTLLVGFLASLGALASLSDLSARELSCRPTSETAKRCGLKEDLTVSFIERLNKYGIQRINVYCGHSRNIPSNGVYNPKKMKIRVNDCWMKNKTCEATFKCSEIDNPPLFNKYLSIPSEEEKLISESFSSQEMIISTEGDDLLCRNATFGGQRREWFHATNSYVKEAKRRGLSCGVGESLSLEEILISEKYQPYILKNENDAAICGAATLKGSNGAVRWRVVSIHNNPPAGYFGNSVITAKIRKLTCSVNMSSLSEADICAAIDDKGINSSFLRDINSAYFNEANARKSLDCKNPKPEISAAELAAEKKADEEARKKAAELAAMIKEDEEEEARKAAELVAKKKKEEALLKFKIEKQKEGAEDFYASVIEYVRSSEKADILKWTDQYEKAPKSENQWNEKGLKAYDDFYNWAFSDIDFKTFFKNRADVLQRDRLDKIQNLISKLSAQITDLRKIAKQQFGLSNADSDVTNLMSKITTVLSNKDKPNELNLPGLVELSFAAQKLIESHKASETRKKRLVASLNKLRAKLQEFARNDFGSAAAKEAVAIVKKIDDALALSTTGKTKLDNLKAEAGNFLEEVEENKNKSSTKTENRKNEKPDQNKDRSATKFDAFQNYAVWDSSTDTQKDAFKEKWVGRYVEVTGPIADVDKMKFSDSHWVILDTSFAEAFQGNAMFNIRAMTGLSKTEARKLVVGQEITVRGTVKRILMGVITLKDAKILSAPSRNLSSNNSGFSPKTLEWSCNVPLITFGAKGPRINATFKFKGEDVYVEFSEPMTGKILSSGPAKPDFVGNVFKLATSGKTVYEVNRVTGSLQVRSSGRIIEASSCSKIR